MTRWRKHDVTTRSGLFVTFRIMTTEWSRLTEMAHRIKWARQHAEFATAADAATSIGIKPVTYRSYERVAADNGREPPLDEIQRIAKKFKVSWQWLAVGEGVPMIDDAPPPEVVEAWAGIPAEKRDDAMRLLQALGRTGTNG